MQLIIKAGNTTFSLLEDIPTVYDEKYVVRLSPAERKVYYAVLDLLDEIGDDIFMRDQERGYHPWHNQEG